MITVCRIENLQPGESSGVTCPPVKDPVRTRQASPAGGHVQLHVTGGEPA
ncbi:hypothetical protein [Streptomyces peucetius]|uniref:Uncharacterized protein n=1 Tax=Streptomyces peucetius TaxID=1950 RepID=A0ABY6IKF7_STRPE|nr:hypothetical protein [Streptomyces peucetius]UYQ66272.1 hypothetical protein OGH68_35710 [Streptomyces peucetius]